MSAEHDENENGEDVATRLFVITMVGTALFVAASFFILFR